MTFPNPIAVIPKVVDEMRIQIDSMSYIYLPGFNLRIEKLFME